MSIAPIEPNRRILVIDDNVAIHQSIAKILGPAKHTSQALESLEAELLGSMEPISLKDAYEVDFALQGEIGLELVRNSKQEDRPYALAFVDMRMPPGWDGVETITRLWAVDSELQVVLCTAHSDYSWREITRQLGHRDGLLILKKPFDTMEVRQLAQALSAKWSLGRSLQRYVAELELAIVERNVELELATERLKHEAEDRARMEVELRLAQKLEAVGQLAAGIAHEVNTPVQYVSDTAHFLKSAFGELMELICSYRRARVALEGLDATGEVAARLREAEEAADVAYLEEQLPKAFERIFDGTTRVASIVRAMKEFAHPGHRQMAPADLNHALENTLTVTRNEYKYVADVITELSDIPSVICNVGDLNQVFLNLIVNAAHAIADRAREGAERGVITVKTETCSTGVTVSIADTGCGVSPEIRDRIFDPFFTTKEVGRGSGQGLAIARSIVDRHRGSIQFESEVGKGTTFLIHLPLDCAGNDTGEHEADSVC